MNVPRDLELDQLFDDAELLRTAYYLKAVRTPEPPVDPAFRMALRRELMQRAWAMSERKRPWWRVLLGPPALAWAGAAAAAVVVALVATLFYAGPINPGEPVRVQSDLDNATNVGLVQPIPVAFDQPMDHPSVEAAVTIEPATKVSYSWQGNTLYVQPVSGNLAPNTQYVVHVAPTARTAAQKPLGKPQTISFVTQTPPTPRPSPRPSPRPTPSPTTPQQAVVASGLQTLQGPASWSAWSADSSTIYVVAGGQLLNVPVGPQKTRTLVADGVRQAALAADGSRIAYVRAGRVATIGVDGSGQADVATADALAVGWQQSRVLYVAGQDLLSGRTKLATLAERPSSAWFSPTGERLVYSGAASSHVFDLRTGQDSVTRSATVPLAWAPEGRQAVWVANGSLLAGDPEASSAATLAALGNLPLASGAAISASWSTGDDILVAGGGGLWTVRPDGSGLRRLADGEYPLVTWAPDASHISFARSTTLWSGVVNGSSLPGRGGACEVANPVLDGFMGARARGDADAALALLDENGRRAYSGGRTLVWRGEPRLHRYYTILEQPSGAGCRYVVRLVLSRGNLDVNDFDEVLLIQPDVSGRPLVHGSTAGQPRLLGKGPEVVLVEVTDPTHLRISFDSDLDPAVSQAIQVQGPGGRLAAQGSYSDRIVTLTLSAPLDPSGTYQLLVPARGVKDVGGRQPQADYSLEFSGPD